MKQAWLHIYRGGVSPVFVLTEKGAVRVSKAELKLLAWCIFLAFSTAVVRTPHSQWAKQTKNAVLDYGEKACSRGKTTIMTKYGKKIEQMRRSYHIFRSVTSVSTHPGVSPDRQINCPTATINTSQHTLAHDIVLPPGVRQHPGPYPSLAARRGEQLSVSEAEGRQRLGEERQGLSSVTPPSAHQALLSENLHVCGRAHGARSRFRVRTMVVFTPFGRSMN